MNNTDIFYFLLGGLTLTLLLVFLYRTVYQPYKQKKRTLWVLRETGSLFANTNPFFISISQREDFPLPLQQELVYGEIDILTLLSLLHKMHPKSDQVFYDLGSGSGRALIATKLYYPFLHVKGIELISALHDLGRTAWQNLQRKIPKLNEQTIDFISANLLEVDFSDGDILFINATSFSPDTWQQLILKFSSLKKSSKILVISKRLPEPDYQLIYEGLERMSWGLTTTRLYKKIV